MSQPQHHRAHSTPPAHAGNAAERYAQADHVIGREMRQKQVVVERRKATTVGGRRRRKGDR